MGQKIYEKNIRIMNQTILQQYANLVLESERISKIFKKAAQESNQLSSKYYKKWTSVLTGSEIILENGDPSQIASAEQEYIDRLLQYFEKKEAQYVLSLFKNQRKKAIGQQKGKKQSYSFNYLPGKGDDIVLIKYSVCNSEIIIEKIKDSIALYSYSIELFDKKQLPLCLLTTFDALASRQRQSIRDAVQQTQQSGGLAQFLSKDQDFDEQQLRKKAKVDGIMISFVDILSK